MLTVYKSKFLEKRQTVEMSNCLAVEFVSVQRDFYTIKVSRLLRKNQ